MTSHTIRLLRMSTLVNSANASALILLKNSDSRTGSIEDSTRIGRSAYGLFFGFPGAVPLKEADAADAILRIDCVVT